MAASQPTQPASQAPATEEEVPFSSLSSCSRPTYQPRSSQGSAAAPHGHDSASSLSRGASSLGEIGPSDRVSGPRGTGTSAIGVSSSTSKSSKVRLQKKIKSLKTTIEKVMLPLCPACVGIFVSVHLSLSLFLCVGG